MDLHASADELHLEGKLLICPNTHPCVQVMPSFCQCYVKDDKKIWGIHPLGGKRQTQIVRKSFLAIYSRFEALLKMLTIRADALQQNFRTREVSPLCNQCIYFEGDASHFRWYFYLSNSWKALTYTYHSKHPNFSICKRTLAMISQKIAFLCQVRSAMISCSFSSFRG